MKKLLFVIFVFMLGIGTRAQNNGWSMDKMNLKEAVLNANADCPQKLDAQSTLESIVLSDPFLIYTFVFDINDESLDAMAQSKEQLGDALIGIMRDGKESFGLLQLCHSTKTDIKFVFRNTNGNSFVVKKSYKDLLK